MLALHMTRPGKAMDSRSQHAEAAFEGVELLVERHNPKLRVAISGAA